MNISFLHFDLRSDPDPDPHFFFQPDPDPHFFPAGSVVKNFGSSSLNSTTKGLFCVHIKYVYIKLINDPCKMWVREGQRRHLAEI